MFHFRQVAAALEARPLEGSEAGFEIALELKPAVREPAELEIAILKQIEASQKSLASLNFAGCVPCRSC